MKILILALSGLGDALMFTPAIALLRKKYPDAQIDALVMYKGVDDFYSNLSELNNVIYFDFLNSGILKSLNFVLHLRGNYNISVNVYPSNRKEYNIISFLIGSKHRLGVTYKLQHFVNLGFLNNLSVDEDTNSHNVETNVRLVNRLIKLDNYEIPKLNFPLLDADVKFADEFCENSDLANNDLIIGIHAGCSVLKNHIHRRWAPEKFAKLAGKLIKDKSAKILLFGGPEEYGLNEFISSLINSPNVQIIRTQNLRQTAAIIKRTKLFITNDSGLMHIASAMGRKVVAIIGPTNLSFIHPWQTEYSIAAINLECSPCFFYSPKPLNCSRNDVKFKCLQELTVDAVYKKAEDLI